MDGDLRTQIGAAIEQAKLSHDPMAAVLELQWMVLERIERAASRPPLTDGQLAKLYNSASRGAFQTARSMVRSEVLRSMTVALGVMALAVGIAATGGYWCAGGFATTCQAQDGGVVCFRWTVPAKTVK
jgi:hypothetical protein